MKKKISLVFLFITIAFALYYTNSSSYKNKKLINSLVSNTYISEIYDEKIQNININELIPVLIKDFIKNSSLDDNFEINEKQISDNVKQLLIKNINKNISIKLVLKKQKNDWKIFLNLKEELYVKNLRTKIEKLEKDLVIQTDNQLSLLEELIQNIEELSLLDKIDYTEKISIFKNKLELLKEKNNILNNIQISNIKLDKQTLFLQISNYSEKNLIKVSGLLFYKTYDNEEKTQEIILYEVVPNHFIYGEPIKSKFYKKIGLKIHNIKEFSNIQITDILY